MPHKEIDMVKVSVVVPIYNIEENLLRKCIESIMNQSEQDFELFLVDDGSTNNSLKVCEEYSYDSRVKVLHQDNSGVSVARNKGLEQAVGEWVMFVDPDDYLESTALEILLARATCEDDIVQASYYYYYEDKSDVAYFFDTDKDFATLSQKEDLYYYLLSYNNPYQKEKHLPCGIGAPWGKIFRTKFIKDNGIVFELELRRAQDIIFNLYAVTFARKIKYVNLPLYHYNYNHLNTMHKKYNANTFDFYTRFAVSKYNWYKKCREKLNDNIEDIFYLGFYSTILFVFRNGPLHPLFKGSKTEVKAECNRLMNLECFDWLKKRKKTNIKVTYKNKILQFLIRNKMWNPLKVIMRYKYKIADRRVS